jgi:hypothetical protein
MVDDDTALLDRIPPAYRAYQDRVKLAQVAISEADRHPDLTHAARSTTASASTISLRRPRPARSLLFFWAHPPSTARARRSAPRARQATG